MRSGAHAMAEHVRAVDVEVLEQGDHVVDELRQGVGVVRRTRSTGAAVVATSASVQEVKESKVVN